MLLAIRAKAVGGGPHHFPRSKGVGRTGDWSRLAGQHRL